MHRGREFVSERQAVEAAARIREARLRVEISGGFPLGATPIRVA